ncbi:DMT family transporter [Rhizobium sp. T1470]|uniref:DMT family transporter n=1 Tax=unclassified Rhizobium TaxID=2613769 RepID=UPI001AAF9833|nr:DMT family transporter [Rhizobium sp. T1473]MCA0804225.1 DMT family transporter [Rhizobium sp. T1473]
MHSEIRTGTAQMTAAMLISGTIGWFVVMSGQPVSGVVFWRCFFGAISLLAVCAGLGLLRPGIISLKSTGIAVFGGVAIVLNWLLLALGALFLGEKITAAKLFWLTLAFAGMAAIVEAKPATAGGHDGYGLGILLALGAAFFYALAALAAKSLKGTPPHLIALIQVATGVLMLLPTMNFSDLPTDGQSWSILITMGVVHTGLMYVLLYGAIQKLPIHLTGALSFIYPIAAILVDRLAFGHALQPLQLIGAAVILVAAAGMNLGWTPAQFLRARAG